MARAIVAILLFLGATTLTVWLERLDVKGGQLLSVAVLSYGLAAVVAFWPRWKAAWTAFIRHELSQASGTPAQIVASAAIAPAVPSPIDAAAFFRASYSSQLQGEVEGNVRAMIQNQPQAERAEFTVRFIATGLINVIYDKIWSTIFRSQLLALGQLNRKVLRREEVKQFYDAAVPTAPEVYPNYSFESWFGYIRSQGLILEHPGDTVEITVRGKDFLKYLVHFGHTADDKKL